ncbi:MAG: hypothetical protein WC688_02870 [Parachlamydiales bacterium]
MNIPEGYNISSREKEHINNLINEIIQKWLSKYPSVVLGNKKINKITVNFNGSVMPSLKTIYTMKAYSLFEQNELVLPLTYLNALLERSSSLQQTKDAFLQNPQDPKIRQNLIEYANSIKDPRDRLTFICDLIEPILTKNEAIYAISHEIGHLIAKNLVPIVKKSNYNWKRIGIRLLKSIILNSVAISSTILTCKYLLSFPTRKVLSDELIASIALIVVIIAEGIIGFHAINVAKRAVLLGNFKRSQIEERFADTLADDTQFIESAISFFEKQISLQNAFSKINFKDFFDEMAKGDVEKMYEEFYPPHQDPHGSNEKRLETLKSLLSYSSEKRADEAKKLLIELQKNPGMLI